MKPTLVVMAAGIGSRYGGLKQIDPIGPSGEIVIDYSVFDAIRAGFGKAVFIIRREIETAFKAISETHFRGRIPVDYAFQEIDDLPAGFRRPADRQKPWGTGHAILRCRDLVREPFAVINADDFYGRASFRVLAERLARQDASKAEYHLVGFVLRNTLSEHGSVARAICRSDARDRLTAIVERLKIEKDGRGARFLEGETWTPLTGDELCSMNMFGFTPALFPQLERGFAAFLQASIAQPKAEYLIPTVVGDLIRAGEASVEVLTSNEKWYGVTYPQDKPAVVAGVRALIERGEYPAKLWA
jgi:NDP-sugar pyrophosphorylase family protein